MLILWKTQELSFYHASIDVLSVEKESFSAQSTCG
jgi:hypothetical protein